MMKTGIELIGEERQRQIEKEGWSPEHDDKHTDNEMPRAAACYCLAETTRRHPEKRKVLPALHFWPWSFAWWKPALCSENLDGTMFCSKSERIKELKKAGALIAAEIDRIQRQG